jgi:membrane-associated phospholipid phosphatase
MSPRALLWLALAGVAGAALALVALDDVVARTPALHPAAPGALFVVGVTVFEVVTALDLHRFANIVAFAAVAVVCAARPAWRAQVRPLLFMASTLFVARYGVGLMKPLFGRLRPRQMLEGHVDATSTFFQGGGSFPSGHGAHAFALALPLALLFPRWRAPLLGMAAFVAVARVAVNDHYPSDVLAGMAWAALVTWASARILLPKSLGGSSRM